MTQSLRASTVKLATATAVVLLAAGGAAASVAAAAPHSAAAHHAAPPVSHQLCYRTSVAGAHIPPNVRLINQFSPGGFKPTITAGQVLCNPVTKTVVGGETFPATNLRAQPAFSTILSNIAGQTGTTSYTDTNATGPGSFFYRVGIQ